MQIRGFGQMGWITEFFDSQQIDRLIDLGSNLLYDIKF